MYIYVCFYNNNNNDNNNNNNHHHSIHDNRDIDCQHKDQVEESIKIYIR